MSIQKIKKNKIVLAKQKVRSKELRKNFNQIKIN